MVGPRSPWYPLHNGGLKVRELGAMMRVNMGRRNPPSVSIVSGRVSNELIVLITIGFSTRKPNTTTLPKTKQKFHLLQSCAIQ